MSQPNPSVQRIAELQQLIADFSKIQRMLNLADTGRPENDIEHSYGLALTCWFIAGKMAPHLDQQKILKYALAHDLVEVHAGDTYVFDAEMVKTKEAREQAAIEKLQQDWPDFGELTEYVRGYADKRDAEAKFVYTIDKMLPPILIAIGEKEDYFTRNRITAKMHEDEKQKKMRHSPEALPYMQALADWMNDLDYYYKG